MIPLREEAQRKLKIQTFSENNDIFFQIFAFEDKLAAVIAHIKSLIKDCIPMTPSEMIPLRTENEKKLKEIM
jgi:hypothetical protein